MLDVRLPRALAGFDLRAGSRLAYRYADPGLTTPALSTRVYSAALERSFVRIPLQMTVGRFHSPDEYYSGFWDGLRARFGRAVGVALLVGFQPDRWNERPSFDRPKASVVLDASVRGDGWRWSADMSGHRVSEVGMLPRHTFAGLSQTFSVGSLRLAQDLQVDQDSGAGDWKISRLGVRGSVPLGGVDVRLGFLRRESYRDWWEGDTFGPREERLSGGVTVQAAGGFLSADVSRSTDSLGEPALGYTASAAIPGLLPGGGELEGSGSYWSGAHGRAWSAAPSIAFGGVGSQLRFGYRVYASDFLERSILTHAGELSADLPLGSGRRASVRLTVQRGSSLSSEALTFTFYRVF
jgi:hypothetical protein